MATVIVVFGTADELNVKWLAHHDGRFPDFLDVICVENYDAPCPLTTAYLRDVCLFNGWRALVNFKDMLKTPKRLHGIALDIALEFVNTPFVFTIDSDCFVRDFTVFQEMLNIATKDAQIAAVGLADTERNILWYPYPYFALYRTDVARKYGFSHRYVEPEFVKPFIHQESEASDPWASERKAGFIDVGGYLALAAQRDGYKVVIDFNVNNYVEHLWGGTAYICYLQSQAGKIDRYVRFAFPSGDCVYITYGGEGL